jgi:hypothetical protein
MFIYGRYSLPHQGALGGSLFDRNYNANIAENRGLLGLPGVETFGLTITADGATTQRHPMMNLMAVSVVFSSAMLSAVLDASAHLAQGHHKDSECIAECIILTIRGLSNPLAVDLIICYGAADMTRFRELI